MFSFLEKTHLQKWGKKEKKNRGKEKKRKEGPCTNFFPEYVYSTDVARETQVDGPQEHGDL